MYRRALLLLSFVSLLPAQDLTPRPVPPKGVAVPEADRTALAEGVKQLAAEIAMLGQSALLRDVRIFHDAVHTALKYDEFFRAEDVGKARELIRQGIARAEDLRSGRARWTQAKGLAVFGYVSRIDKSVQPYGLVIPESFDPKLPRRWRLDVWLHGRSENLNEISFLHERQRSPGEFTPPDTIVLHTYGRYNNANKLAGEEDVFEAIRDVKRRFPIDEDKILVRGFSMGGASTWHLAAHRAGEWAAAAPGAGFAETPEYARIMQDAEKPTWYEQKLWHLYNATDYAVNLSNVPIVAYSGEIDKQKQAADIMAKAMEAEGLRLTHVIGPNTAHKYHPDAKVEISRRLDAIAERGRERYPKKIRFTTWTLRYDRMKWVRLDALDQHWERARIEAEIGPENTVRVKTENVAGFTLEFGPGAPLLEPGAVNIVVNGTALKAPGPESDGSCRVSLDRSGAKWALRTAEPQGLRKRHGLQGPIDDAFMNSFIFVRPTGQAMAAGTEAWVKAEQERAIKEWRRHFRGEPQVKDDTQITDEDIAGSNLVLWGDPGSNRILTRIMDRLPLKWTADSLTVSGAQHLASTHVALMIYPNPLNPKRYVVLNSGFTWREADYLTNAREVPKLPDWAVVDTRTPADARHPGKVVAAGFFDEAWKVAPVRKAGL